jgi:hypothetical protein
VVSAIVQLTGPQTSINELTLGLITLHERYPRDIIAASIEGLGWFAVAATLVYLFGAARARNELLGPYMKYLALAGGVVAAIAGVAYESVIASKASDFVHQGNQTYMEAHQLTSQTGLVTLQLTGQAAALVLAMGFVLISLNAMRVGLLTKFLGYLGIFAGIFVLFGAAITPVPIVQAYWLIALAYLLSGRWPTGVPPAWQSGRAEKWPTSAEMREKRAKAAGARGRGKPAPTPAPEAAAAPARGTTRATTPKRKRKHRN